MTRTRGRRRSAALLTLVLLTACTAAPGARGTSAPGTSAVPTSAPGTSAAPVGSSPVVEDVQPPSSPSTGPTAGGSAARWWGVDSSGPMTDAALVAVRNWYRDATPQVWGRYLNGSYAVSAAELAWARRHGIYVDLLVPDDNCSQCAGGGDICRNDVRAEQAVTNAQQAIAAAVALSVPAGAVLFKDLEQVARCLGEPTAAYVDSWYRTVSASPYRVGLYGNSTTQEYAFARAYCQVLALDPQFGRDVVLDATEPEPELGKPRAYSGPDTAPPWAPDVPACAPPGSTVIWQYGESVDAANYADIDLVAPDTAGLLAPAGGVSGGDSGPAGPGRRRLP